MQADVARALAEDIGPADVSAALAPDRPASALLMVREQAVIAGRPWFEGCFLSLDPGLTFEWFCGEGAEVQADALLCRLRGRSRALLSGERCALNFLQTLSATATRTARFVAAVAGTRARILDTRKTLPGLRQAQKYAVRVGGGVNHRMGLFDAVMIKENHLQALGTFAAAIAAARRQWPELPLIVEVETLAELDQALAGAPDRVLLDDFSLDDLRRAVALAAGRVPLEVSGGVSLDTVRAIAETGVDCISVGALTKHIRAIDLSLRFEATADA